LDANRHLSNITYLTYAGENRMTFLNHIGLSHKDLQQLSIEPIVFNEHLFYFKKVVFDDKISVSLELSGMSEKNFFFFWT